MVRKKAGPGLVARILRGAQRALAYFLVMYTFLLGGLLCAGLIFQYLAPQ